jgi:hypothetical protein
MKGPPARTKHDVRRVWECPACGRRLLTGGEVVTLTCECPASDGSPQKCYMHLVEPPPASPKKEAANSSG